MVALHIEEISKSSKKTKNSFNSNNFKKKTREPHYSFTQKPIHI